MRGECGGNSHGYLSGMITTPVLRIPARSKRPSNPLLLMGSARGGRFGKGIPRGACGLALLPTKGQVRSIFSRPPPNNFRESTIMS